MTPHRAAIALVVATGALAAALAHVLLPSTIAAVMVIALGAFCRWAFLPRHHLPRDRVRDMRLRLHLRLHPGRGHATMLELWLRWSRFASYRESKRTRPDLTRGQRLRDADSYSVRIGRAHLRHGVRVDVQSAGAIIGPPRSNKTAVLSRIAMTSPGALLVTSSKPDLFNLTSGLRARCGPIWVFNPSGIGDIPSNVRWNPLDACQSPETAMRRADAFAQAASTGGTEDATFWAGKASDMLRGMFSAAALDRADLRRVNRWVGATPSVAEAIEILERASTGELSYDDFAAQLGELLGPAEKTSGTIKMVMSRALGFLNDPNLARAVMPGLGQHFDIDQFLLSGGTLYMLARSNGEECTLGPLFAALATEIHERALQLGARMEGGRLAPPLRMVLDEVTRIAPVPLPAWLADSGGQGVQIWSGFHGISQLRSRWGEHGAQTVLDTSTVKVVTPGVTDPAMLEHLSRLCGRVSYRAHKADESWQFTEVMSESMIRELPSGFALAVRSNCAVLIVKLARGWDYRPYKRLKRRRQQIAPVAQPAVIAPPVPDALPALTSLILDDPRDLAEALPVAGSNGNGHHKNGEHPWSER